MTQTMKVNTKEGAIDVLISWLKSEATSLITEFTVAGKKGKEMLVRYPHPDVPNVDVVLSMEITNAEYYFNSGTWTRLGYWLTEKELLLTKTNLSLAFYHPNILSVNTVLKEMKTTFLPKAYEMLHEMFPTRDTLKEVIIPNSNAGKNLDADALWVRDIISPDASTSFVNDEIWDDGVDLFNDTTDVILWALKKEEFISHKLNVLKKSPRKDFLIALKRAYIRSVVANAYKPSRQAIIAKRISKKVNAYLENHRVKRNFLVTYRKENGKEVVGMVSKDILKDSFTVYKDLAAHWKAKGAKQEENTDFTLEQVTSISYKKDIVFANR